MYFSPPTKCFVKIFFLTSFTQYRLRQAVQSQQFKVPDILLVNNKNGIISLQYKHNFNLRLKNHIK